MTSHNYDLVSHKVQLLFVIIRIYVIIMIYQSMFYVAEIGFPKYNSNIMRYEINKDNYEISQTSVIIMTFYLNTGVYVKITAFYLIIMTSHNCNFLCHNYDLPKHVFFLMRWKWVSIDTEDWSNDAKKFCFASQE